MSFLWVAIGSALGGLLRFAITRITAPVSASFPYGTLLINVVGSFVIGYFGAVTVSGGKFPVSENLRLFVMVGLCGGFTTFSSFSLQTFDLMRSGGLIRAIANVAFSVVLCVSAVALGYSLAHRNVSQAEAIHAMEEDFRV